MPKPNHTLTRRHFLKAAAYTSALSASGLSTVALADSSRSKSIASPATITLLNQSNKTVVLDAANPVSLEKVHGWVVVKLNKSTNGISNNQKVALAAGQQQSFAVDGQLAPALKESGSHIVITNEFSELDNLVPMATYDVVVV